MTKDILFYSERCEYSMKIYNVVKDKSSLLKICIDDPSIKLPTFVSAVPLIYISKDKRIIIDDGVDMWINTNLNVSASDMSSASQPEQNKQVNFKNNSAPSGDYYTGGFSFSSSFSSLDGEDANCLDGGCGFADLSSKESINTPQASGNKMDTNAMFEQYQQMRNSDLSRNSKN